MICRNKSCFSLEARQHLVEATFLPVLAYGDLLYINTSAPCLHMLHTVYHGALRFTTNSRALYHHCTLYSKVNWPSLSMQRLSHWYVSIYKAILGKLPCYLSRPMSWKRVPHGLRSQDMVLMSVAEAWTELGKKRPLRFLHHLPGITCRSSSSCKT